jgi:hypothetical protein
MDREGPLAMRRALLLLVADCFMLARFSVVCPPPFHR